MRDQNSKQTKGEEGEGGPWRQERRQKTARLLLNICSGSLTDDNDMAAAVEVVAASESLAAVLGGAKRDREEHAEGIDGENRDAKRVAAGLAKGSCFFRLLVSAKRVGSILGRGGSVIKALQEETGCRIRIEARNMCSLAA